MNLSKRKLQQCRACLSFKVSSNNMFTGTKPICNRLSLCSGFVVESDDGYPSNICNVCLCELDIAYGFRKKCEASMFQLGILSKQRRKNMCNDNETTRQNNDSSQLICIELDDSSDDFDNPSIHVKEMALKKSTVTDQTFIKLNPRIIPKKISLENSMDEEIHDTNKKYLCTSCGNFFSLCNNFLSQERVHSSNKPHMCEVCRQSLAQPEKLIRKRTHSVIEPYECNIYPSAFSLPRETHPHTEEKPFACKICNITFVRSYHLINHLRSHIGKKSYICIICNNLFTTVYQLSIHYESHMRHIVFKELSLRLLTGGAIIDRKTEMPYAYIA